MNYRAHHSAEMQRRWCWLRVISALLSITSVAGSPLKSTTVQASVPIVNECNGLPVLFSKDYQYRNTFDIVIKKGTKVKFQLLNPKSIGNGEFFMTCLQNTKETDVSLTFSKNKPFTQEIILNTTCVPTVGVLKLCNSAPVDVIVSLTTEINDSFLFLPTIELKSFETYGYNKTEVDKFLNRIIYYGFVRTPRAQIVIGKVDVAGLRKNNLFVDGLKIINDVIEKYIEYSGRTVIPVPKGPRINVDLEKHVLLLKSEQCTPEIHNRRIGNYTFIVDSEPKDNDANHIDKTACTILGYFTFDRTVVVDNNILNFFTPDAKKWVLLHEIGHNFDLSSSDLFINLAEIWVNIYSAFYQSRFFYKNELDYWMQEDINKGVSQVQKLYDSGKMLQSFPGRQTTHFLMALFTVDNHDSSVFRSYNIRTMNDADILNNMLKSIAIFIKDQYDINVAPFVERVIYKGINWLNLTNIYDLAESENYRMPCFYYPNKTSYPGYKYVEHYLKSTTNLRLCSTKIDESKTVKITIENSDLLKKRVKINSVVKKISNKTIELKSRQTTFLFQGAINKTAVVLPTYTFCSLKTNYECTVAPKLLTYDDQNPSQLLPPFRFDIFGNGDILIAVLQVDIRNKKMTIKTLKANVHSHFPNDKGAYVQINLYNPLNSQVAKYLINGTNMPLEEIKFDIGLNYTFEFEAKEKKRVKILDFNLNDLEANKFKIYELGVAEVSVKRSKIRKRFTEILSNDLKYKPYLKKYQHLTDLLRILERKIESY